MLKFFLQQENRGFSRVFGVFGIFFEEKRDLHWTHKRKKTILHRRNHLVHLH